MMNRQPTRHRILSGAAGPWATPIRGVLYGLSKLYGLGVDARNRRFDRGRGVVSLDIPVISVGNITVGGTGKTPLVIDLLTRLTRMGRNPAVVARGYKSDADGVNDEQRLIQKRCPGVAYVADADRVTAAQAAQHRCAADTIVVDDGFQHRRLGRTLDIVAIDATSPFGFDHLLPRGLLREPVSSLRRADAIVITRCDHVARATLKRITDRIRRLAPDARILRSDHRVVGFENLDGQPYTQPIQARRVALLASIGNPAAFATTVRTLEAEVVAEWSYPDHHRYRRSDVRSLLGGGRSTEHELVLTTEKDAVKLAKLDSVEDVPIVVVKVAIDFAGDGSTMLDEILEDTLRKTGAP